MGYERHGISLLGGWFPITVEVVAVVLLLLCAVRFKRRWWLIWIPVALAVAALATWWASSYMASQGVASDPAPAALWWWFGAAAFAIAAMFVGFRSAAWWRRGVSVLAVIAAITATGIVLNQWVGYFPTVQKAWAEVTAGPLPDQVNESALAGLRGRVMSHGVVVDIDTGWAVSHFSHRTEYVYLPPAWFSGATPPHLPALMMIAGEFNTPADWIRTGNAIEIVDAYAKAHGGQAPVLVFPDVGGSFNNDTECVDGPRGNVATHLTDEVRPTVMRDFGVAASWGVVGWSMGGTCAVDLTTMHADQFSVFEDIAGDAAPTSGTRAQTVTRLFKGSEAAYLNFDPATVMSRHGTYTGVHGWFDETGGQAWGRHRPPGGKRPQWSHDNGGDGTGGRDSQHVTPGSEVAAARTLCTEGAKFGIECSIHMHSGGHTWQFAQQSFTAALPTLATDIGLLGQQTTGRA